MSNYPDGLIVRSDGTPALFVTNSRIDLGLTACRDAILSELPNEALADGNDLMPTIDKIRRSYSIADSQHESLNAAYNAIGIALRDQVLPHVCCDSFNFGEKLPLASCGSVVQLKHPFKAESYEHQVFNVSDHYALTSDDSVCFEGEWIRHRIFRHFVGIIYLSNQGVDFKGGDLVFPEIGSVVHPSFGTVVIFPASPKYANAVKPITEGTCVAVRAWYTVEGYH